MPTLVSGSRSLCFDDKMLKGFWETNTLMFHTHATIKPEEPDEGECSVFTERAKLEMSKLISFHVSVILKAHLLKPKPNRGTIWLLTRTHTHTIGVDVRC